MKNKKVYQEVRKVKGRQNGRSCRFNWALGCRLQSNVGRQSERATGTGFEGQQEGATQQSAGGATRANSTPITYEDGEVGGLAGWGGSEFLWISDRVFW